MSEDIRAGEIAVTLPETFDAGVYFIGRIRTPWKTRSECPRNARGSDAVCRSELEPSYAAALARTGGVSALAFTADGAAPLRCVRRCARTRSR